MNTQHFSIILIMAAIVGFASGYAGAFVQGQQTKVEILNGLNDTLSQVVKFEQTAHGSAETPKALAAPAKPPVSLQATKAVDSLFQNAKVTACLKAKLGDKRFAAIQGGKSTMTAAEQFTVLPCYNQGYAANFLP